MLDCAQFRRPSYPSGISQQHDLPSRFIHGVKGDPMRRGFNHLAVGLAIVAASSATEVSAQEYWGSVVSGLSRPDGGRCGLSLRPIRGGMELPHSTSGPAVRHGSVQERRGSKLRGTRPPQYLRHRCRCPRTQRRQLYRCPVHNCRNRAQSRLERTSPGIRLQMPTTDTGGIPHEDGPTGVSDRNRQIRANGSDETGGFAENSST